MGQSSHSQHKSVPWAWLSCTLSMLRWDTAATLQLWTAPCTSASSHLQLTARQGSQVRLLRFDVSCMAAIACSQHQFGPWTTHMRECANLLNDC